MRSLDSLFLSCPACGGNLSFQKLGMTQDTTCTNCGYAEKAGSQQIVEFVSSVLQSYLAKKNINKIVLGDSDEISISLAMVSNGILPALVSRSNEYRIGNLILSDVLQGSDILSLVRDDKGLFGKRVTYTGTSLTVDEALFSVAQQLIPLSYTIDETILFTATRMNVDINSVRTLFLRDVPSVSVSPTLQNVAFNIDKPLDTENSSEMSQ